MKKAIVLLSGGLDSTTCLAYAKANNFDCYALSFNYQQRHVAELTAAKKIAAHFQSRHLIIDLPTAQFAGSALTDIKMHVPEYEERTNIPATYVPGRNTIFLSYALSLSEVLQAHHIFIGVSAIDYSGYPDCRPEYIRVFQKLANLATKVGVESGNIKIHTPLIDLSKAQTIRLGLSLGIDYAMTVSCYCATAAGLACGKCDSCYLRRQGFQEAGVKDATRYVMAELAQGL